MSEPQPSAVLAELDEKGNPIELDGRRQRRDRNRDAVVDAMLDLHTEGLLSPSVAQIAERSGVSHRSVFRYFDDLEELTRVAIDRAARRYASLAVIPKQGKGTQDERIDALVEQRLDFYAASGASSRAGRLKAPFQKLLQDDLQANRRFLRDQLRSHFAAELDSLPEHVAGATMVALEVLTSLESYDLMDDQGLSRAKKGGTLRSSLKKLLSN